MTRVRFRVLLCPFLLVTQSACTLSLGQINEFRSGLPVFSAERNREVAGARWTLQFLQAELILGAESRPDGSMVFSNDRGLRITFDGEEVTEIRGFPGAFGEYKVSRQGSVREITRDGVQPYQVRCIPPVSWRVSPTKAGKRTSCRGALSDVPVTAQHTVELAANGAPRRISSTIVPGSRPLILEAVDK